VRLSRAAICSSLELRGRPFGALRGKISLHPFGVGNPASRRLLAARTSYPGRPQWRACHSRTKTRSWGCSNLADKSLGSSAAVGLAQRPRRTGVLKQVIASCCDTASLDRDIGKYLTTMLN
jgi:hypothetical protein